MVEKAPYQVIKKVGDIEIRHYPPLILAQVLGHSETDAFNHLFNYIQGNNNAQTKIAMTTPVITSSQKIPMTAPVITTSGTMAFVLPSHYQLKSTPKPLDPEVKLQEISARCLAVLRFSGNVHTHEVQPYITRLLSQLNSHDIPSNGEAFLMRYNAPFTPGFFRRNEVAIEVLDQC